MRSKLVLILTAASLVVAACGTGRPAQAPYSCGNVTSGHCYVQANVGNNILGFQTTIYITSKILAGNGFITNEFWLRNYSGQQSWIEVGYRMDVSGIERYFWAQNDENGIYQQHDQLDIPQAEVGTSVVFRIYQLKPGTYRIQIDGSQTHFSVDTNVQLWPGTTGGYIIIGQELAGTSGAEAGLSTFAESRAYDHSGRWDWLVDPSHGATVDDMPPYGGWLSPPSSESMQGGVFSTYCCSPAT